MIKSCGFSNNSIINNREYKNIKLWSSYGLVEVPVYTLNNDFVVLQNYVEGLDGINITVKCIDAPRTRTQMSFDEIKTLDASIIHLGSNQIFGEYVAKMFNNGASTQKIVRQLEPLDGVDIHFLSNQMLNFLHTELNINSPTNNGMVLSLHKIRGLENAYFNSEGGGYMIYGLGGNNVGPMGKADVVSHELGHGIINNIAGLVYEGESGALNESYADVIGATFEHWIYRKFNEDDDKMNDLIGEADYLVGEDVMLKQPFMRSMSNPNAANQPSFYQGPYWSDPNDLSLDNGGVHVNSGIGNYCFYLVAKETNVFDACRLWIKTLHTLSERCDYYEFATKLRENATAAESIIVDGALIAVGL